MDAASSQRAITIIRRVDDGLATQLEHLLNGLPRLADGRFADPREPVTHPLTEPLGCPPLDVRFNSALGFFVTFADPEFIGLRCAPINECNQYPNPRAHRRRAARTVSAHRGPHVGSLPPIASGVSLQSSRAAS